ncbi:MAG: alpha-glucosidase [Bacteroidales bacterium]|nr:alpha-glucosidase [Bacteroidales bacterium]
MFKSTFLLTLVMLTTTLSSLAQEQDHWWEKSVFYQIYMPSYQDSNDDGYSDFRGMTARLDYLQSLGIDAIWLTPFLKSPKIDNGYDIADYYQVDPVYGTMSDFKVFLAEAHARNLKVIMDMVLNHSSTDCYWFQEARKSVDNPYRDYYIWRDEPNNWESFFGGPAWEYDSLTQQYYYHKFDKKMADLNWNNPALVKEMLEVLRFWLDLGIDGFRLDVINFLNTDGVLDDNPAAEGSQIHKYDINQPGLKNTLELIRSTVDEYDNKFLVGEVGSDKIEVLKIYQSPKMMDVVFNFNFGSIPNFDLNRIYQEISAMEKEMPGLPTLFFGSHDNTRLMNRLADLNLQKALALHCLILTAKGVPFIYYGDEIGMQNIVAHNLDEIVDIQAKTRYQLALNAEKTQTEALEYANLHNRDRSRSPMQWDSTNNAGFTTAKPWIKIQENYQLVHVDAQLQKPESFLNEIKKLLSIRKEQPALQMGDYSYLIREDQMLKYGRVFKNEIVHIVINFGESKNLTLPDNSVLLHGDEILNPNEYLIYKTF